jgi:TonB family protein
MATSSDTPELPVAAPASASPGATATAPQPAPDPVAQTLALIQPWIDYVPKRQRRLGLFICIALLLHLGVIYFILIDATRAELRHQARIHVTVDNPPAQAEQDAPSDRFWDRVTDPRLFVLPVNPMADSSSGEPPLDFSAINASIGSQDLPAPVGATGYQFTRAALPPLEQSVQAAMVPPRQHFSYEESPPPIAAGTTWQWDDALNQRQPVAVPGLPSPVSDTDLAPTLLRVAVRPDGTVDHVLVEQSCGSGRLDLDQQAVLAARKARFKSTDQPGLVWGRVTIFWHYAPEPREVVVPTPPSST